jgi:small subunit ribosomal protein S18
MSDQDDMILGDSEEQDRGYRGHGGRMGARRRQNNLRLEKPPVELYKDVEMLRHYLTDRGKIRPRRQTGLCARDQRRLAVAVKRARHLALLPFTAEHTRGE